jgi:putative tryptophan/tyrosine transport system substrate-binding protein
VLESVPESANAANLDAFRSALRSLGYTEGGNLIIDYRSSDGASERFHELVAELRGLGVDLILARGTPAARAAKDAAGATPVLMATMGNPSAFAASFAKPGGNITGVVTFTTELSAKRVELLKSLVPNAGKIGLLHNMGNPAVPPEWSETQIAARALRLDAELFDVRSENDLLAMLGAPAIARVDGLIVGADGLIQAHRDRIISAVERIRVPSIYPAREFVEAGGLAAYGVSYPDLYFRLAILADKILRGATPGDLPIEQPTKFEFMINARTAKALGLAIPPTLLARADEVIE